MSDKLLQIFAKAPVQGQVKTRLIPDLGSELATKVYVELLEKTISLAAKSGYKTQLWCAPDQEHVFFKNAAKRNDFTLRTQCGVGLGERMQYALEQGLNEADNVVLIGADCPVFTYEYLTQAFQALSASDVVLGPAEDGGFVLVGSRKVNKIMFDDVTWGSSSVLKQTRRALGKAELTNELLGELWDVDTLQDLKRWRAI